MPELIKPPRSPDEWIERAQDVIFSSEQVDLIDCIFADLVDSIPIFGDITSGTRTAQLIAKPGPYQKERAAIQGIDTIIGIVPVIGDVIDLFFPANTINHLIRTGIIPPPPKLPKLPEPPARRKP